MNEISREWSRVLSGSDCPTPEQISKMQEQIEEYRRHVELQHWATTLIVQRYFFADNNCKFHTNHGEHYVYMWKHANGIPYYIGSGKGQRWKNIGSGVRSDTFCSHLNQLDSVCYMVYAGMTEKQAREAEFCCIYMLSSLGYNLAQTVWTVEHGCTDDAQEKKKQDFMRLIKTDYCQKAVSEMIDRLGIENFDFSLRDVYSIIVGSELATAEIKEMAVKAIESAPERHSSL